MEFSMPLQIARYSLVILMTEDGIKNETIDISIITFNKPSEFSRADCDFVVALNFSFLVSQ